MNLNYKNFALSAISSDTADTDDQIEIEDYSLFPDTGEFTAVIWDSSKATPLKDPECEIVTLEAISEGLFQAVRGQEETSAKDWSAGSYISNVVTAETMEYLLAAASASASAADISDSIYTMGRYDTSAFLIFGESESYKTITLPEKVLAEGITYSITNRGSKPSQTAKIYPYTSDSFAHTSNPYMTLTSGSTLTLCLSSGEWVVKDYVSAKPSGIKKIDANNSEVSFGDGVVFADTSAGSFSISLPADEGIYGVPLTIIKYDDLDNYVYVNSFAEEPNAAMIYGRFESLTFFMEPDGTVHFLSRYTPDNIKSRTVIGTCTLRGHERFVLADASAGTFEISLPHSDRAVGESIRIKKIDSSANAVDFRAPGSDIEGGSSYSLTAEGEYVCFASDGENWYRVG